MFLELKLVFLQQMPPDSNTHSRVYIWTGLKCFSFCFVFFLSLELTTLLTLKMAINTAKATIHPFES